MILEKQIRMLLGPADPAADVQLPALRLSATDLIELAEAPREPSAQPGRAVPVGWSGSRRRLIAAATALGVSAGAAAVGYRLSRSGTGGPGGAADSEIGTVIVPLAYEITDNPPTAGEALRALAARIGATEYDAHAGQYDYHHVQSWGEAQTSTEDGHVMSYVEDIEDWITGDGSGRQRITMLDPQFPDEASRRAFQPAIAAVQANRSRGPIVTTVPAGPNSMLFPSGAGQAEVAAFLHAGRGTAEVVSMVGGAYRRNVIDAAARAQILLVLADMPGLGWCGTVTDRIGRSGVAVTVDTTDGDQKLRLTLVFDPRAGHLLASEDVWLADTPLMNAYTLILAYDRTDSPG